MNSQRLPGADLDQRVVRTRAAAIITLSGLESVCSLSLIPKEFDLDQPEFRVTIQNPEGMKEVFATTVKLNDDHQNMRSGERQVKATRRDCVELEFLVLPPTPTSEASR